MDGLLKFAFVNARGSDGKQRWQSICFAQINCHLFEFTLTLRAPTRIHTPTTSAAWRIKQINSKIDQARQSGGFLARPL